MQCHRIYFRFSSLPRPVCHAAASLPAHRDLARGGGNTKLHLLPEYSRSPRPHPRMSGGSGHLPYSMPEVDGVKSVSDNDVHNIVLSYLMHNCYKETAETFLSSTGLKLPVDYSVDVDKRKAIYNFVLEGNALKAIELTEELAPTLLENDMDLHFDLLSLHFIDLVRSRKCTEALEFGQKKLTPFGKVPKYVEKLEEFMALLAYEEPEKSPTFHLLSPGYRQNVADSLNRVVLAHANLPAYSTLERVIQQVAVVRQYLEQEFDKDSYPPFSLKAFLNK